MQNRLIHERQRNFIQVNASQCKLTILLESQGNSMKVNARLYTSTNCSTKSTYFNLGPARAFLTLVPATSSKSLRVYLSQR